MVSCQPGTIVLTPDKIKLLEFIDVYADGLVYNSSELILHENIGQKSGFRLEKYNSIAFPICELSELVE